MTFLKIRRGLCSRQEQTFTKRALRSEADWIRVFGAWSAGVTFFFHHRTEELWIYKSIVMDLFRTSPNTLVAIEFDVHVRDKYRSLIAIVNTLS